MKSCEESGIKSCLFLQRYFNKGIALLVLKRAKSVNEFFCFIFMRKNSHCPSNWRAEKKVCPELPVPAQSQLQGCQLNCLTSLPVSQNQLLKKYLWKCSIWVLYCNPRRMGNIIFSLTVAGTGLDRSVRVTIAFIFFQIACFLSIAYLSRSGTFIWLFCFIPPPWYCFLVYSKCCWLKEAGSTLQWVRCRPSPFFPHVYVSKPLGRNSCFVTEGSRQSQMILYVGCSFLAEMTNKSTSGCVKQIGVSLFFPVEFQPE